MRVDVPKLNMFVVGDSVQEYPSLLVKGLYPLSLLSIDLASLRTLSITQNIGADIENLLVTSSIPIACEL